jgi:adenosylcobinamide-GDP ribazoletransferase
MPGLDRLLGALGFLTRAPVPSAGLIRAAPLFPVVGGALGALVGATALGLGHVVPPLVAAAVAVALELVVTGALHVDGLADSADGLAGRDRDHALAIMRDHAVGTYGACALILDLVAKTAALAHLDAILPVVGAFALSRAAALPLAAALPYARPGEGTGRLLAERLTVRSAAAAVLVAAAIAVAAGIAHAIAALVVVTAAVYALARRRLGGVTGDVMGAAIELTATVGLVVAVA